MKSAACALLVILMALFCSACTATTTQTTTGASTGITTVAAAPTDATTPADAVVFTDPVLERLVREKLGKTEGPITTAEAESVTELFLDEPDGTPESDKIKVIDSLQFFKNLKKLHLVNHQIEDIGVLAGLTQLEELDAANNRITDLGPIAGLTSLRQAVFWKNQITDLGPVADLVNLEVFSVTDNRVRDVSPLKNLTKLYCLELRGNLIVDHSPIRDLLPGIRENDGFEPVMPEDAIVFSDAVLEQRVRQAMGRPTGDITVADALTVKELDIGNPWQQQIPEETQIKDISSLKYFRNLFKLSVYMHQIWDIDVVDYLPDLGILDLNGSMDYDLSPVSGLHNLRWLNIGGWRGNDLTPLSTLTQLEYLNISYTQITDIGPLRSLTCLIDLFAEVPIRDFSPLAGHDKLKTLYILTGVDDKYIADTSPLAGIYPHLTDKNFTR